jgi:hypothetical protein
MLKRHKKCYITYSLTHCELLMTGDQNCKDVYSNGTKTANFYLSERIDTTLVTESSQGLTS